MTEAVITRPGRLTGPHSAERPATKQPPAAGAVARPVARARAKAEVRRPYHLAVAISAAAGVYAVSLAGVTALQAGTDAGIEAARRPTAEAIAAIRADHDALEAAIARAETTYASAADAYAAIAASIGDHETALGLLAGLTAKIEGTAASLPSTLALPSVSRTSVTRATVRPATNATSGASGKP